MANETEVIFHHNGESDDGNKVRHHDNDNFWIVESYEAKTTRAMIEADAVRIPSRIDGHLFKVNAKQLIAFIAAASGLNVEFRNRKRAQLTPENAEKRRLRMAEMNAKRLLEKAPFIDGE